ncbi:2'-5' RNA ligase family protein [Frigoribacterium sp. CFBP 8751]|uniref:2'-5' RNA ligase family protein n=1 Tax=Frigoribacterium sp. CFBP 8751 TaxID=2775277 RepID=UPI0017817380|nr:2'-5' RNA ligase family protein [Frigoribacterium sp. CFBP 8751]
MHSLELLLDPTSDEAVRGEWRVLSAAGLPSQGDHAGTSNAPHVTLVARPGLDPTADPRLLALSAALPLPAELGGLLLFGAPPRGLVLVRPVVVTGELLDLHARVHESLGGAGDVPHTVPGRWTPHVTLASRLTPDQVARAVDALADADTPSTRPVVLSQLRRWDPSTGAIIALGPVTADEGDGAGRRPRRSGERTRDGLE